MAMSFGRLWSLGRPAGLFALAMLFGTFATSHERPDHQREYHCGERGGAPRSIAADHAQDGTAAAPPDQAFERDMSRDMATMMHDMHAPGYTGNPDVDFLAMMIPHHRGAIDMARLVLMYGEDPLTRRLAEEIIGSQQTEIVAMEARLNTLRHGPDAAPGGFPALSGTRGAAENPAK